MNPFEELRAIQREACVVLRGGAARVAACPDLGARVFVELGGQSLHRLDLAAVRNPNLPFNNFGGVNLWPAPEGGPFGFNYEGDRWQVQPAINQTPFALRARDEAAVEMGKRVTLVNRKGTRLPVEITRRVGFGTPAACLADFPLEVSAAVETRDAFAVADAVSRDDALIAAWNLEQFASSEETVAFVRVDDPRNAINFDYYEPPPIELVAWRERGFTFRVNGRRKGQIGLRQSSCPEWIGFYDLSRRLVCVKENRTPRDGLFFNIADNDQPAGPFSAADTYSIFNSDSDMAAFELETIGPLLTEGTRLVRSPLVSVTTYARFASDDAIRAFLDQHLREGDPPKNRLR